MEDVGKIIHTQLMTMNRVVVWSWGAHAKKSFNNEMLPELGEHLGGLLFKVEGRYFQKHIAISLSPSDTYTVSFGVWERGKFKVMKQYTDVYVEELIELIDRHVEGGGRRIIG